MCRVNEYIKSMDYHYWNWVPKIVEAIPRVDYKELPTANSKEQCSILCTQYANKMKQPGCCEFRVDEQGNCTWTGANGHPYLAYEYRFSKVEGDTLRGTSKNTMAALCSSGKIYTHEIENENANSAHKRKLKLLRIRIYRSFMQ